MLYSLFTQTFSILLSFSSDFHMCSHQKYFFFSHFPTFILILKFVDVFFYHFFMLKWMLQNQMIIFIKYYLKDICHRIIPNKLCFPYVLKQPLLRYHINFLLQDRFVKMNFGFPIYIMSFLVNNLVVSFGNPNIFLIGRAILYLS